VPRVALIPILTLPPAATSDFGLGDEEEGTEETRRVVTEAELAAALEQEPKDRNLLRALLGSKTSLSWSGSWAPKTSAQTSPRGREGAQYREGRSGDESSRWLVRNI